MDRGRIRRRTDPFRTPRTSRRPCSVSRSCRPSSRRRPSRSRPGRTPLQTPCSLWDMPCSSSCTHQGTCRRCTGTLDRPRTGDSGWGSPDCRTCRTTSRLGHTGRYHPGRNTDCLWPPACVSVHRGRSLQGGSHRRRHLCIRRQTQGAYAALAHAASVSAHMESWLPPDEKSRWHRGSCPLTLRSAWWWSADPWPARPRRDHRSPGASGCHWEGGPCDPDHRTEPRLFPLRDHRPACPGPCRPPA